MDSVALAQALIRCPSVTPADAGAIDVLKTQVDAMSRSDDFPAETLVWAADGKAVTGAVAPPFEARLFIR